MICRNTKTSVLRGRNFFLNLINNKATSLSLLTQTHAQIILNGLHDDLATVTKLTHKFSDLNAIDHATLLCSNFPNPDLFLYNVLIRGLSNNKLPQKALSLYLELRKKTTLSPGNFTYAFVVSASSCLSEKVGILIHAHLIVDGFGSDLFVGSALVDMYNNFTNVGHARKVFDEIPKPDTVLWNTMISGLVKNCFFEESLRVFKDMAAGGITRFDLTTLTAVLPAPAELQEVRVGMMLHCLAVKLGFQCHEYILTGLISLYSKCGKISVAKWLFEQIGWPDLISYNAMISGFTCNSKTECSVRLFKELLVLGERVNSSTIVGLIPFLSPFGWLDLTRSIHSFCLKSGMVSNPSVSTALMTVYTRLCEIESARQLFNGSPEKTLASWNAMISGYAQSGQTEMAVSLFREMQGFEILPNPVTITSILSACARLGALSLGKWVHSLINEGFESNIYVSTALIDMYAKCGSIAEARQLFDTIQEKNEVTWNAMISGYGLHGRGREALNLFTKMVESRISPTRVTFLSVLYACSHSGLVREGEEIFYSMVHDHGFEPLAEHYACMVDLLGRAGKLDKALEFINKMPVFPGSAVWGALLGACMIHKDRNMAQLASDKLFELDPENVGYYVLLSNIYSADRNYPQAASVRQVVKRRNLEKTPGCTLIEINETPYVFTSNDRSHPQREAIYSKLEKLMEEIREAGFLTETITAFHDVEEEEKELMVKVHSEKLAIAFGLIASEPGTEIRIIKNLRVCLDCHNFTKFVSKISERVIVVRDSNRFHHFKDGLCSCGDYW